MNLTHYILKAFVCVLLMQLHAASLHAQSLDLTKTLRAQSFLDNQDFDWYQQNIPLFECADAEITTTYYYRWDLLTKHLTYTNANSGYSFTEFIDRPFWSGAYGAISCPAGHQLYEARWLKDPRIANNYSRYWFQTSGAQPRNYSTWLADSVWNVHLVHPNEALLVELLPDLVKNYEGWESRHFVPSVGLFWQTGHDDGMEFNINSRQTKDILRGAPSYRPSFNAYMWADAMAIAQIANLAGKPDIADRFSAKANALHTKMMERMWDEQRKFFFPLLKDAEERDGYRQAPLTKTYETGRFAGDPHGRELIGYVPWQFQMLRGRTKYDEAWKKLMDRDGFFADFGPSTVERNDPMFLLQKSCCWWSGQSWPYATTQTLKGLANFLQSGGSTLSKDDYVKLLGIYARSHRKDGKPYLAEALHPDTGSFEGHDGYNHSEHYFHSGFCDLIFSGFIGLIPRLDEHLQLHPLASNDCDYFAVDGLPYRGHMLRIVWDKTGDRYSIGKGVHVFVDGKLVANAATLEPILVRNGVPYKPEGPQDSDRMSKAVPVNYAVNNDGTFFPRITASFSSPDGALPKLNDGNYWYLLHPPNRWTCSGSENKEDWIDIDLGLPRKIHSVKAYVLDDHGLPNSKIAPPQSVRLQHWHQNGWRNIGFASTTPDIKGHRPLTLQFESVESQKFRLTLVHAENAFSGLTELELWGDALLPITAAPQPKGNLVFNDGTKEFPRASASYHDRFGGIPRSAIDGKTNFLPSPTNRWTSYESPNEQDWLQIDLENPTQFRRVDLAIYDDRGGVQKPLSYSIEVWQENQWKAIADQKKSPEQPAGGQWNSVSFKPVTSDKLRIVFVNRDKARSGVSEVMVWNED